MPERAASGRSAARRDRLAIEYGAKGTRSLMFNGLVRVQGDEAFVTFVSAPGDLTERCRSLFDHLAMGPRRASIGIFFRRFFRAHGAAAEVEFL